MSEKRYKVIITPTAESALYAYDEYLRGELFNDQAADRWINTFDDEIASLHSFPARYPLIRKEPWHGAGIRMHPLRGHNIYYWIDEEHLCVYVFDIIGQRMNQDKQLLQSVINLYQEISKEQQDDD